MKGRRPHPNKEIEAALNFAEAHGWRIVLGGHHAWGKMYCPSRMLECRCGEFCITSIWCTPKSPDNHACALRRVVQRCILVQVMH